jgi:hypothetical protein
MGAWITIDALLIDDGRVKKLRNIRIRKHSQINEYIQSETVVRKRERGVRGWGGENCTQITRIS